MRGCGIMTGAVPGAVITAASAAVTSRIPLMKATAIPKEITAPNMIASIHGDVIRTLGPVRYCECEFTLHPIYLLNIRCCATLPRDKLSFPQEAHHLPEGHRLTSISPN